MIYYCIVPLYYDAKTSHGSKNKKRLFENSSRRAQILVHLTGYFNIWWSFESWQLNVIRSWRMKIECFAPTMTKKIWGNMCSVLCESWQRKSTLNFFHSFSHLHVCHRLHKLFLFLNYWISVSLVNLGGAWKWLCTSCCLLIDLAVQYSRYLPDLAMRDN